MKIKSSTVYFHSSGRNAENANLMPKAGFGNFVVKVKFQYSRYFVLFSLFIVRAIELEEAFLVAGMVPSGRFSALQTFIQKHYFRPKVSVLVFFSRSSKPVCFSVFR
jgi:hypothetical protein